MEFYPRLHQTQLFARQVTGKNLAITNTYGRLELGVSGVNVRQIVVLVVDQVQTDDDAVERCVNRPQNRVAGWRSEREKRALLNTLLCIFFIVFL